MEDPNLTANPKLQPVWKPAATRLAKDTDLSREDLLYVLDLAAKLKQHPRRWARVLEGRYLSLLFEKPSLRTRLTFELAAKQLGGDAVFSIGPIAEREPVKDVARNLDRWTHAIVARTHAQKTVDELAHWARVPVINALSDLYHPCQILADMQTVAERLGGWKGRKLAYIGDGNNVAHSLLLTAPRLGMDIAVACPDDYCPHEAVAAEAGALAVEYGTRLMITRDAREAARGAHVVYTDVWTSMGRESEARERRLVFRPYQVNAGLMAEAAKDAIFLHCLPAKRGEEVTDEVIESPQSVVFDQAENRLHAQKALLVALLG
jgi:ornithine carbamoyltransferase